MNTNINLDIANSPSKFGWIADGAAMSHAPCDQILVENKSFVALASLGAIVPGWVLIIPRQRAMNLAVLNTEIFSEFVEIRGIVQDVLARHFSARIFEFEHGPSKPQGLLGCGVEQAHLHMVPLSFDLIDAIIAEKPNGEITWPQTRSPWDAIEAGRDYWLARDTIGNRAVVVYPDVPVSQGLRKIIASRTGAPDSWNYRTAPFFQNVAETQRAFISDLST